MCFLQKARAAEKESRDAPRDLRKHLAEIMENPGVHQPWRDEETSETLLEMVQKFRDNFDWGNTNNVPVRYAKSREELQKEIEDEVQRVSSFNYETIVGQLRRVSQISSMFGVDEVHVSELSKKETFWSDLIETSRLEFERIVDPFKIELQDQMDNALLRVRTTKKFIEDTLEAPNTWVERTLSDKLVLPFESEEELKTLQVCCMYMMFPFN